MQNRLNNLTQQILKNEWIASYNVINLTQEELSFLSKKMSITLPEDFVEINKKIRYDIFSWQEFLGFYYDDSNWNGIIKNNIELRKEYAEQSGGKSDMSRILVLADDDGGSVFMITQDSPEKPTPVIWCDAHDMYWYSIDGKFRHSHDEWPSFTDFFEFLVEEEEKKLLENN